MSHKGKIYRCSRLVVLPDYQGCGVGRRFLEAVGDEYLKNGYRVTIVTSSKSFIRSLKNSPKWKLKNYSRRVPHNNKVYGSRSNVKTAAFEYYG